ncbi:MBL fold metallo-hydrolase [Paludibaculum fermentans]|uniref:MBL fold metallo-hydrolase n=1 Tax=Paludibaculum fermentans TaxID=1473598 RepID=A0A7S7SPX9_PALFE|nr:MBL fold metallo-hydrolase [Paludibaculum fermentans]QOY91645.1 MBL fold metallo-hydrolase [Paludibaculum fermentans]
MAPAPRFLYDKKAGRLRIVKACVLASSSAGNSTFIGTDTTRILIDAGLNRKETFARLAAIGEDPARLDAIFITHEHSDHILGLPVMIRALASMGRRIPVFLTHLTAPTIDWGNAVPVVETFQAGSGIEIGDLSISSFTIPHDAVDPVGYTIKSQGIKISIATDLGYMPDSVKVHLQRSHFLLLESNHHPELLKLGPYPWHVKQRILSRKGHLSNDAACEYIANDLPSEVQTLILGHLSEHNNTIWETELSAKQALETRGLSPRLIVAEPRKLSDIFQL